jgi:AraC-like DNA-binding protein
MPIFMDLHNVPGVTPKEVAEAHSLDMKIQDEFCCRAMTYWIDQDKGSVFCLIEAPDKEAVSEMHKKAHGLIPNEIIEVDTNIVKAFLGRINDPDTFVKNETQPALKVFDDPAFRTILVTKTIDVRLLQHSLGKEKAQNLTLLYNTVMREQLKFHDGSEVALKDDGFIVSFVSVDQAVACALAIQKRLQLAAEMIGLRIGLHAGVPVDKHNMIFGNTLQLAKHLCSIGNDNEIVMSSVVRSLYKDHERNFTSDHKVRWITLPEENFLEMLNNTLDQHWDDPQFSVMDFCSIMSISKPQLYRKIKSTTGLSPNSLLREYRLLRSLDLLRNEDRNIMQTTFDTGFSSPSYFTKCFQKRFGIQPLTYLKARI